MRLSNFIYRRMVSSDGISASPPPRGCAQGPGPPFVPPAQVQKYLIGLRNNLPPMAVLDRTWPPAPYKFLSDANQELKGIFYLWKVGEGIYGSPQQRGFGGTASPGPPALPHLCSVRSTGSSSPRSSAPCCRPSCAPASCSRTRRRCMHTGALTRGGRGGSLGFSADPPPLQSTACSSPSVVSTWA